MSNFDFANGVVSPERDGMATDDFDLNDPVSMVFLLEIPNRVGTICERANELHDLLACQTRAGRESHSVLADKDRVRLHRLSCPADARIRQESTNATFPDH